MPRLAEQVIRLVPARDRHCLQPARKVGQDVHTADTYIIAQASRTTHTHHACARHLIAQPPYASDEDCIQLGSNTQHVTFRSETKNVFCSDIQKSRCVSVV